MAHRTHRRRSMPQDWDDDVEEEPNILEFVLRSVTDTVTHSVLGRLKAGVERLVQLAVRRAALAWVGATVLIAGIVLCLFAGVKGLEALNCPTWLSYLAMGVVALGGALLLLKPLFSPRDEEPLE
jgi:hypothetical protein